MLFTNKYANWIRQVYVVELSPLGEKVAYVIGRLSYGRSVYEAPVKYENVDWSNPTTISVIWSGPLASWDRMDLSLLCMITNRLMMRVKVNAITCGRLELTFSQRESREGQTYERLPHCEDILRDIDGKLVEDGMNFDKPLEDGGVFAIYNGMTYYPFIDVYESLDEAEKEWDALKKSHVRTEWVVVDGEEVERVIEDDEEEDKGGWRSHTEDYLVKIIERNRYKE